MLVVQNIGFPNGDPRNATGTFRGLKLRDVAARALEVLNVEFRQKFGRDIPVLDGLRSYAEQVRLREGYLQGLPGFNIAAIPGRSKHGWGLAMDFGTPLNRQSSEEWKWLYANSERFGWVWTGEADGEPWHFEFTGVNVEEGDLASPAPVIQKPAALPDNSYVVFVDMFGHYLITPSYVRKIASGPRVALEKLSGVGAVVLPFAEFYELWSDINAANLGDTALLSKRSLEQFKKVAGK